MNSGAVKQHIREALAAGEVADCRTFSVDDRVVDAAFIRSLILAGLPAGLRIIGLSIEGVLDLRDCGSEGHPLPALRMELCRIVTPTGRQDGPDTASLDLSRCHIASLSLRGTRFSSFRGRGMACHSEVDLCEVGPVDDTELCWMP